MDSYGSNLYFKYKGWLRGSVLRVRRTTFKDGQFQSEIQLLKPVNMDLSIKRNLSASWYHSIPDNQINAHLKPMSVSVCLFIQKAIVLFL